MRIIIVVVVVVVVVIIIIVIIVIACSGHNMIKMIMHKTTLKIKTHIKYHNYYNYYCICSTGVTATEGNRVECFMACDSNSNNYSYSTVTFTLRLRRNPLSYIINLIIPCALLSFIAVATFILQSGCQHRLTLDE